MRLTAGTLQLDGAIVADGGTGTYPLGGGGSGGGVRLDVGTLSGSGKIYARGGQGFYYAGAGGGGRIAVYYDSLSLPVGNLSARGGYYNSSSYATQNGGAGTVFLKGGVQSYGDLVVDNAGILTYRRTMVSDLPLNNLTVKGKAKLLLGGTVTVAEATALSDLAGVEFAGTLATSGDLLVAGLNGSLTVDAGAVLPANLTLSGGTVTLAGGLSLEGSLRLQDNATLTASKVEVQAAAVQIDAGSKIDVSGKGYLGGAQPGNASDYGRTSGNTTSGGSYRYSGGSYGGYGGKTGTNQVNAPYGDPTDPNDYGSGGGGYNSQGWKGGNGGGLVRLAAEELVLNGSILADGMSGRLQEAAAAAGSVSTSDRSRAMGISMPAVAATQGRTAPPPAAAGGLRFITATCSFSPATSVPVVGSRVVATIHYSTAAPGRST